MKSIDTFLATEVYGDMNIDIKFYEDITFLYGLNGSGKTTALRLIMAMLVPSVKTLLEIPFEHLELTGQLRNGRAIQISCEKNNKMLYFRTTLSDDELRLDIPRMDADDLESTIERELRSHPLITAIRDISSPIFLGLDRRFIAPVSRTQRPQFNSRQMALEYEREKILAEHRHYDPGLAEVSAIVLDFVRGLKARQQKADSTFRKQLLLDSFAYVEPRENALFASGK